MKKIIAVIIFVFVSQVSYSQVIGGSIFVPGELAWKAGVGGGFTYGFSSGLLMGKCGYEFEGLKGPGFYITASGSMPIDYFSDLYATLGYQSLSLEASKEMKRIKAVQDEPNPVEVNMASKAEVSLASINLDIYYKRKLVEELFVLGGIGLHFIISDELNQDETIKDDRFIFSGSEKTSDLIYKGDIKDLSSFQFDVRLGLGYDFRLGTKYLFSPNVFFSYPFTKVTSSSSLRVMTLSVGAQISYIF